MLNWTCFENSRIFDIFGIVCFGILWNFPYPHVKTLLLLPGSQDSTDENQTNEKHQDGQEVPWFQG